MSAVRIFVEGVADERFIHDYIKHLNIKTPEITPCNGWKNLENQSFINEFQKSTDQDGINLVIFDADEDKEIREKQLKKISQDKNIKFELFLFPNNNDPGALESLLENIINPENQCILDCWSVYEDELRKQHVPWKKPPTPTTPANKTKIYGYLEALHGTSNKEKEKIKEKERNYLDKNLWNLDSKYLKPLKEFLLKFCK